MPSIINPNNKYNFVYPISRGSIALRKILKYLCTDVTADYKVPTHPK